MLSLPPIHFASWAKENAHRLQPPVNNYPVQMGDFIVMAVGGPNARTDYHVNETEEWFYQFQGEMLLKVVDEGGIFKDIVIREGEMFLLPAHIPHNPCRFANTVGLVIERQRPEGVYDRLRWYCEKEECRIMVYEEAFLLKDITVQLKTIIDKYYAHPELRTCAKCGHVNGVARLVDDKVELCHE